MVVELRVERDDDFHVVDEGVLQLDRVGRQVLDDARLDGVASGPVDPRGCSAGSSLALVAALGQLLLDVFLGLLDVLVQFLEGVGGRGPVRLEVLVEVLEAVGEVLDVRPRPERLRTLYLVLNAKVVGKVLVVQISVVSQQET